MEDLGSEKNFVHIYIVDKWYSSQDWNSSSLTLKPALCPFALLRSPQSRVRTELWGGRRTLVSFSVEPAPLLASHG